MNKLIKNKTDKYRIETIKIINFDKNKVKYTTKFDVKTKQFKIWLELK